MPRTVLSIYTASKCCLTSLQHVKEYLLSITGKVLYCIRFITTLSAQTNEAKVVIAEPTISLTSFMPFIWMSSSKWYLHGHILDFTWLLFVCLFALVFLHNAHAFHSPGRLRVWLMFLLFLAEVSASDNRSRCPRLHALSWPWPYKGPEESRTKTQPTHTENAATRTAPNKYSPSRGCSTFWKKKKKSFHWIWKTFNINMVPYSTIRLIKL